jgi:hypothetical protein
MSVDLEALKRRAQWAREHPMKFVDGDVQTPGPCYVLMPPDELDTIIAALERAERVEKAAQAIRALWQSKPGGAEVGDLWELLDQLCAALAATPETQS